MAWVYDVPTGQLYSPEGALTAHGYSGNGADLNNPSSEGIKNHGPIPDGHYTFTDWQDHPHKGPKVCHLTPAPDNEMYGRDGFMVHGDNQTHTASDGCIILPRFARDMMAASLDQELVVRHG